MGRTYDYIIKIDLPRNNVLIYSGNHPFKDGSINDSFTFKRRQIVINCTRTKIFKEDDIIGKDNNSIHTQIRKALLLHILINAKDARISRITVSRVKKQGESVIVSKRYMPSNQPFPTYNSTFSFDPASVVYILKEDDAARKLRVIVSHWLNGIKHNDAFFRFEGLWRAFERLSLYHNRNNPNQRDRTLVGPSMSGMKSFMLANQALFTNAAMKCNSLTYDDIRILKWREFFKSEYSKNTNHTCSKYKENFLDPFNDQRLVSLMTYTRPYIENILVNQGRKNEMDNIIMNKPARQKTNHEIAAMILPLYGYYYRCKAFHGEIVARQFILPAANNKDSERLTILSELLSCTCTDLINSYSIL